MIDLESLEKRALGPIENPIGVGLPANDEMSRKGVIVRGKRPYVNVVCLLNPRKRFEELPNFRDIDVPWSTLKQDIETIAEQSARRVEDQCRDQNGKERIEHKEVGKKQCNSDTDGGDAAYSISNQMEKRAPNVQVLSIVDEDVCGREIRPESEQPNENDYLGLDFGRVEKASNGLIENVSTVTTSKRPFASAASTSVRW